MMMRTCAEDLSRKGIYMNSVDTGWINDENPRNVAVRIGVVACHVRKLKSLKMYMPLLTPEAGVIRLLKSEGAVLAPGDCIATMELENPSCVKKSDVYMGKLPSSEKSNGNSTKAVHKMRKTLAVLKSVLQGYFAPEDFTQKALVGLFSALNEPLLPVEEIEEAMSSLAGRIPLDVFARITNKIHTFKKSVTEEPTATHEFNVTEVIEIIDEHTKSLETERQRSDFEASVMSIREIATKYRDGLQSGEESVLTELINEYFTVESHIRELSLVLYVLRVYRPYIIESIETISFNDVFAKTFRFKSPVVDALAVGVAPAESYDDLASLLRRNSSASLHELHNSEESSHIKEYVEKKLPKPVESYQKISPNFERHGAIVRLDNFMAFQNAFIDIMWSFYWDLRFNNEGGRSMKQPFRHKMVVNQS
ncbi:hypothetical protein PsorP6_013963 [Peronosclerospora sorghi]|uniref:Uncharacterized protein n=1 Tax=Peronosclerospora sorghi TaxID=230839 RepID=A0ACC0VIY1_9STRA|nr:hypothetical protein PsorP6_013963 [Peronosclerospora sorghi]